MGIMGGKEMSEVLLIILHFINLVFALLGILTVFLFEGAMPFFLGFLAATVFFDSIGKLYQENIK